MSVFERAVIRQVAQDLIFRREPEAMSAARFPFAFARASELLIENFESIPTIREAIRNYARADIERDDQLGVTIR